MTTPPPTVRTRRPLPVLHLQRHLAVSTGSWVWVACLCSIGHNHTHGEWIDRFQRTKAASLEVLADMYDSDPASASTPTQ